MPEVGAYEAKTHFSRILQRVARGECFIITKHGVPVAVLAPVPQARKRDPEEVISDIETFGEKHSLGGLRLKDLIEEGRQ